MAKRATKRVSRFFREAVMEPMFITLHVKIGFIPGEKGDEPWVRRFCGRKDNGTVITVVGDAINKALLDARKGKAVIGDLHIYIRERHRNF